MNKRTLISIVLGLFHLALSSNASQEDFSKNLTKNCSLLVQSASYNRNAFATVTPYQELVKKLCASHNALRSIDVLDLAYALKLETKMLFYPQAVSVGLNDLSLRLRNEIRATRNYFSISDELFSLEEKWRTLTNEQMDLLTSHLTQNHSASVKMIDYYTRG